MRVCIAGAGRIGRLHAGNVRAHAGVTGVVVVDADPGAATALANDVGGQVAPTLDEAIDGGVDALVVAAPTPLHAPMTAAGVRAGVAVFCEKPIAASVEEARSLVGLVHDRGALVQVGFQRRFDPAFVEARGLVATGGLGRAYLARLATHDAEPPPIGYVESEDGIYAESLIHDFDAMRFVTGREAVEVYASALTLDDAQTGAGGEVRTAAVVVRLDDGSHAVITGARHDPRGYDVRLELLGSRESVVVGGRDTMRALDGAADGDVRGGPFGPPGFIERFREAYALEMQAFLDLVAAGGGEVRCSVDDGLHALEIAAAAYASQVAGGPVPVGRPAVSPSR